MFHSSNQQSGVTLVEVLIAISIITTMLVAIGFSVTTYVEARSHLLNEMKAAYLAEEGYELVRALREDDWNALAALPLGTDHSLAVSTTTIAFSASPEVIDDDFTRWFELTEVYRDSDDDITVSTTAGATVDPDTRQITVSVLGPSGTSSVTAILTNLHAI